MDLNNVTYYSQNGEDFILDLIFRDKKGGFFVEVGCIDGRRFSNTLTFEERGWKGICIEAHPSYIELLKRNRPNSIVCHVAAGEEDRDSVIFYANERGSLSTLDGTRSNDFKRKYGEYFSGFKEEHVKKQRLDTIFQSNNVTNIDFLSLDIEGYEVEALSGLDLSKYRPSVLVIESENKDHERKIDDYLIPNGYIKSCRLHANIFYVTSRDQSKKIKGKVFENVRLKHTRHPVDSGNDEIVTVDIDTRSKYQKILSKIHDKFS